ncbi:MAG: hypothetical protein ABIV48_06040 [Pyrinomonadaceae bacterium]
MTHKRIIIISAILAIGAGCWSVGSKAKLAENMTATDKNSNMSDSKLKKGFLENLPRGFEQPTDDAGRLLLREYGAVFLARNGAVPPKKVVFKDEADVAAFQASLKTSSESIGGFNIELQTAALEALQEAQAEAKKAKLTISPRGGNSSRRGYNETVSLWASRVNPGFTYWVGKGRVKQAEANRIKSLSPYEQVPEILKLEKDEIYFAKSLDKSIIYSVAPPGTSQHLSMLALDVKEFDDARVRQILASHGWFQTVLSDLPHFTFIGVSEKELPGLGLKKKVDAGRDFWIPDI